MLTAEEQGILDYYNSLSDDEILELDEGTIAEFEVVINKSQANEETTVEEPTVVPMIEGKAWDKLSLDNKINHLIDNDLVDIYKELDNELPKEAVNWDDAKIEKWEQYKVNQPRTVDSEKVKGLITQLTFNPNMYRKIATDRDISKTEQVLAGVKDGVSSLGRGAGALIDQGLAVFTPDDEVGGKSTDDTTMESMSQINVDRDKGMGDLGQNILRDWSLPASIVLGGGLAKGATALGSKLPAVASVPFISSAVNKIPKFAKALGVGSNGRLLGVTKEGAKVVGTAIKGGLLGGAEESAIQGVNVLADDGSANVGNIPVTMAMGTVGNLGGDLLQSRGKRAWESLFGSKAQKVRGADKAIEGAYNDIPFMHKGDYNIDNQIKKYNKDIADIGNKQKEMYGELDNLIKPSDIDKRGLQTAMGKEINKLKEQYLDHTISKSAMDERIKALQGNYVDYMIARAPKEDVVVDAVDRFKPRPTTYDVAPFATNDYITPSQLHKARMSLDTDKNNILAKLGGGKQLGETGEAFMTSRNIINDELGNRIEKGIKNAKALPNSGELVADLEVKKELSKQLPSIYPKRDVLETIGGSTGNLNRTLASKTSLSNPFGGIIQSISPESGIRQRQIGSTMTNPFAKSFLNTIVRELNEDK